MKLRRVLLLAVAAAGVATAGLVSAQVPPTGTTGPGVLLTESATGTTAGATATFPAVVGKVNYLCGLSVAPGSATTAIVINITTTGLTNNFTWSVGAPATAAGATGSVLTVTFTPCPSASAPNTAITVVAGALGAGGAGQDVNAWGYLR